MGGCVQMLTGFLVAPLPAQPLAVAEADAGALEGHVVAFGDAECLQEVGLGRGTVGQQGPAERTDLEQPRGQLALRAGQGSFNESAGLGLPARTSAGLGQIDQPEQGLAIVRRPPVVRDQLAQPVECLLIPVLHQRGHAHRVMGPRGHR